MGKLIISSSSKCDIATFFPEPIQTKDYTLVAYDDCYHLGNEVEVIRVESSYGNQSWFRKLSIKDLSNLREFLIGDHCFRDVRDVSLSNLNALERFIVGEYCFGLRNTPTDDESTLEFDSFSIKQCKHLKEIYLHNYSFSDYSSFGLIGLFFMILFH